MVEKVQQKIWQCRERVITFGPPCVMGILNITPDSFYAGSRFTPETACQVAASYLDHTPLLDVGAESTRPGAAPVTPQEECTRLLPIVTVLRAHFPNAFLSIDTRHTATAAAALEAGADIINDVSGCAPEEGMLELIASTGAGYVLTHATGKALTETELADPATCTNTVIQDLRVAAKRAEAAGVRPGQIQLDPGLGFAKTHPVSTQLLRDTAHFAQLPYSLMIGASRKRFLGAITGQPDPARRGAASISAALWAIQAGANVVRVHDVAETADALQLFLSLNSHEDLNYV